MPAPPEPPRRRATARRGAPSTRHRQRSFVEDSFGIAAVERIRSRLERARRTIIQPIEEVEQDDLVAVIEGGTRAVRPSRLVVSGAATPSLAAAEASAAPAASLPGAHSDTR